MGFHCSDACVQIVRKLLTLRPGIVNYSTTLSLVVVSVRGDSSDRPAAARSLSRKVRGAVKEDVEQ